MFLVGTITVLKEREREGGGVYIYYRYIYWKLVRSERGRTLCKRASCWLALQQCRAQ